MTPSSHPQKIQCSSRLEAFSDRVIAIIVTLLLFWLTIVPFTTAFIGDYPTQPLVVALYAFVLGMAGMSFALMGYYAFFVGKLIPEAVPQAERRREYGRAWIGTGLYFFSAILALIYVYGALFILAIIPLLYVVPTLIQQDN